jgi:uncharacterized membrane protein
MLTNMGDLGSVIAAAAAFVGTHFVLSHPLRKPIIGAVGNAAFLGIYSLVAAATLAWLALAYRAAPVDTALWPVGDGLWAAATVVMLLASILLMGSLIGNPALPKLGSPTTVLAEARGVYAVTRHPMMWAFALWGLCHIAVYPVPANIILAAAVIILAAGRRGAAGPQEGGASARHVARLGKVDRLLAVRRDRLRPGTARRVRQPLASRRPRLVARRDLGTHSAGRLAGRRLALAAIAPPSIFRTDGLAGNPPKRSFGA